MTNRFEAAMAKRKDEELIKIVGVDRTDYEPHAVEAAEAEIRKRNIDPRLLEEIKANVEAAYQRQKKVDAGKELLGARIIHMLVDTFIYYVLAFALAIGAMWVIPYSMENEAETFEGLIALMIVLAFLLYYVGMELAFQRTVGKFITGTKVVMKDGGKPGLGDILKRTFCRIIPFDSITFLVMKEGFHDSLSGTMVVKVNDPLISSANTPESSFPVI